MQEHATRRGWTIAAQNKEIGSHASEREQRERLLAPARRRDVTFRTPFAASSLKNFAPLE
jgi:hypothetical protein